MIFCFFYPVNLTGSGLFKDNLYNKYIAHVSNIISIGLFLWRSCIYINGCMLHMYNLYIHAFLFTHLHGPSFATG